MLIVSYTVYRDNAFATLMLIVSYTVYCDNAFATHILHLWDDTEREMICTLIHTSE